MLLSRKFVSDYVKLPDDLTINKLAEDMTSVGNEYDYAGKLIDVTNLTIGEIVECCDHPDSDHLHVCKVDVGSEILNIVCGAPNARCGIKVIVALPGAKLPGGEIKKGIIRGVESNGMLCSIKELGLDTKFLTAKDIEGIHELPNDCVVGEDPIKYLELDDEIVDFELTSNRGDLLSILGMAYELGAIYKTNVLPIDLSHSNNDEDINSHFKVDIQTEDCTLFLAKEVKNVTIKESPTFIKNRLIASGIRPINNVVDISNYVMLETGQPLHFYDHDNLGDKIIVRNAFDDESVTTLDNVERKLSNQDIVIATDNEAIGLAGVMGGLSTEVENTTKNIIIESAIFNNTKIRKTSKKILRSEASNRFEKGLDPKRTYMAIERSCHLLEKYANATIVGGMVSYDKTIKDDKLIDVRFAKVNKVLGINISKETIIDLLSSLDFKMDIYDEYLTIYVPSRRLDIKIEEDLIEEIGRFYGMDNIKAKLPTLSLVQGKFDKTIRSIKNKLVDLGLNETLTYSLIPEDEVHKYTCDEFTSVMISDPMTEERNTLRYSLLYSLHDVYNYNAARNNSDISIFEIGASFKKEEDGYKEGQRLAILLSGNYYLDIKPTKVNFYILKGIVEELLDYLGFNGRYSFLIKEFPNEFHPGQSAILNVQGIDIGILGKLHPNVAKKDIFVFEMDLAKLLSLHPTKMSYKDIPKFPSITKDVSFIIDKDTTSETIEKVIKKAGGRLLTNISVFDVYNGEDLSIAYKLTFTDPTKTLTDEEVMNLFDNIIKEVESKCPAKLKSI